MSPALSPPQAEQELEPAQPTFRSSAVARMAGMPVSTLRIWEQRYRAVAPATAPTGQRQYSAADVERVVLLRRLTQLGHAIGALAGMGREQLDELSLNHAATSANARHESTAPAEPLRLVIVGQGMALRLERPAVIASWQTPPRVVAVYESLKEATRAATAHAGMPMDLLVWQASDLQAGNWPELDAAQRAWRARHVAVAYRFAGASARDELIKGGASVVREPSDDEALVAWLNSLASVLVGRRNGRDTDAGDTDRWPLDGPTQRAPAVTPRRFDDATLTEFAALTSGIACECPSHVAELLLQIASFEGYSASCSNQSPADAELHAYLHRVAGAARMLFETALERVATAEGLALP